MSFFSKLFGDDTSIDKAVSCYQQGDYAEALRRAECIIEQDPKIATSWRFKGECLGQLDRYQEAIVAFDRAIWLGGRGEGSEELHTLKAIAQACAGNEEGAIVTLEEAIPGMLGAYRESAERLLQQLRSSTAAQSSATAAATSAGLDLDDLTVDPSGIDPATVLADWTWLAGRPLHVALLTAAGDAFVQEAPGAVHFLDTQAGTLTRGVAPNCKALGEMMDDGSLDSLLQAERIKRYRDAGIMLSPGECYALVAPLIDGGAYEPSNVHPCEMGAHLARLGRAHREARASTGANAELSQSEGASAPVVYVPQSDDEIAHANETARSTFRFFWRELAWERRRIVPGLGLACVKVPFHDPPDPETVEQMWVGEIDFDGQVLVGELLNSPHALRSVKAGDRAEVTLAEISDWMYAINDRVYGAYTVNLMRSRMSVAERREHDTAWGLDFGDPSQIELVPPSFYGGGAHPSAELLATLEHPMAANMGSSLDGALRKNPSMLQHVDERGLTMLHVQALAGDARGVETLLRHGAKRHAASARGMTPLDLAKVLAWPRVIALLEAL